jgi:hypothetical protein
MDKHKIELVIRMHEAGHSAEEISNEIASIEEEERVANLDALVAQEQCDTDHDAERYYESVGMSEYDLDPGVQYNDAGEPKGWM